MVNASLLPSIATVEVANIRELIEIGSVEKALALGHFRRRPFDHPIEDGDVLLLSSAVLHSEACCSDSWRLAASLALYVLLFATLVSTCALLYSPKLRGDVRSFAATLLRRRGPKQEPLLGAAQVGSTVLIVLS